jgi:hypothetical protein
MINPKWVEWTKNSGAQVRVVLDDIDNDLLTKIREIVNTSRIICFLGFSYDKGNLAKLGFPKQQRENIEVFGSAFNLTPEQMSHAQARMGLATLSLAGPLEKCIDVLQNRHILRD